MLMVGVFDIGVGEIREGSERVGFRVITLDGRTAPLSYTTIST